MSVIITNISERYGLEYGKNHQIYALKINHRVLCKFEHIYEDGLVMCLRRAADAFEASKQPWNVDEIHFLPESEVDLQ